MKSCGIHLRAITLDKLKANITRMCCKITHNKLPPYLPGDKELNRSTPSIDCTICMKTSVIESRPHCLLSILPQSPLFVDLCNMLPDKAITIGAEKSHNHWTDHGRIKSTSGCIYWFINYVPKCQAFYGCRGIHYVTKYQECYDCISASYQFWEDTWETNFIKKSVNALSYHVYVAY